MESLLFQAQILWPAMVAGLLVLGTHIPLGREVLQRGIVFLDLAIAQIAALGVIAANIGFQNVTDHSDHLPKTSIAIITAVIASLGLYKLRRLTIGVQEAIIGILFVLSATGSVLLLTTNPHGGERLKEILVGQILWFQAKDLLPLFLIYAGLLCIWFWLKNKLGEWLFYPLFAIVITLSTQVVGVYLVFASLIIPSLATFNHKKPLLKAFLLGAFSYGSGLTIAALFDLPAGATIVWCLAVISFIYYFIYENSTKNPDACGTALQKSGHPINR